ncbi:ATP-binding protein [Oharaeibacter diazotrophicus]|uniref:Histidine kinase/DNA gyrase B/HSP90-like ATPase n=1 Tax=Oharaeibacter diazotrophicus TaxID=1920512 RepID=A0A4R6RPM3_9HYPH|nr:ATP-binding protein [Oharaeibacter diazotrophicus]TDP88721.1 histidine kinase/DNA gyrase B/HSP90-like ATPase [Oharaeibacter diazotrophicus]GLS79218.1 histidine kinase [Oharaeibacter diazotrophicus]
MSFAIIPQKLSIKAMRSSGYKDSAYAIAELIDNSIQAGEGLSRPVAVEVICIDKAGLDSPGGRRRLDRLAVYDNASGMDRDTLRRALQFGVGNHLEEDDQKGIGKFGMGLPNSSISQARRVDVYTWRDGKTWHSYLDVDEIQEGEMVDVPEPQAAVIPPDWLKVISTDVGESGTLVIWTQLDLMKWKQSTALLRNAEMMIGRIYRYFINTGKATIRLAAYEEGRSGHFVNVNEEFVRPNDPLMLMRGTSAPAPYNDTPAFEPFGEPQEIEVGYGGQTHIVTVTASICKVETRKKGGRSPIGALAKKNQGVSVVRADRELELNRSFENSYDPRERWWGIEVAFTPALDAVFGVSNNKQSATSFQRLDIEEDAAAQSLSLADYQHQLDLDNDPRLPMYEISRVVDKLLETIRAQVARMREGERTEKAAQSEDGSTAEDIATRALRRRQERLGETGASDKDESRPDEERTDVLTDEIEQEGLDPATAREIAVTYVKRKIKFLFRHADFPGFAVFDITSKAGVIIITINTKHPAHAHLFDLLREGEADTPESPALQGLKLLLTAWARMEDEASGDRKIELEDTRGEWGRIARDFLREADE